MGTPPPPEPSPAPGEPADVVRAFLRAFEEYDAEGALALVDEDIVYTNVSLPTIYGRAKLADLLARGFGPDRLGFRAYLNVVATDGDVVLTDRVDELRVRRFVMRFWAYGRFVVRDGRIAVWRDSFDWFDLTVSALRGLLGLLSPGLNRRMPGD